MTLVAIESFDNYGVGSTFAGSIQGFGAWDQSTAVVDNTRSVSGSNSLKMNNSSVRLDLGSEKGAGTAIAFKVYKPGSGEYIQINTQEDDARMLRTFEIEQDGTINLIGGSGGPSNYGIGIINLAEWTTIEWETIWGDSGEDRVYVNGVLIFEQTNVNNESAQTGIRYLKFSEINQGDLFVDDLIVWLPDGLDFSPSPLDVYTVETLFPDGIGASSDFTPNGDSNQALTTDESPGHDGDTTYNSSSTSGHRDLLTFPNLSGTNIEVQAAVLDIVTRKETGTNPSINAVINTGVINTRGAYPIASESYGNVSYPFGVNPETNLKWTRTELEAAEFGYEIV